MGNKIDLYADPDAMEAIRLYTDPLLPTFGNKKASAAGAGCSTSVFHRQSVQDEIKRIIKQRSDASRDVEKYMSTYTMDAARELVRQLSTGRDLEVKVEELDKELGKEDPDHKLVMAIARHNKTALEAARERRDAAVTLIRYRLGSPEKRMRSSTPGEGDMPQDLRDMSDEDLQRLGSVIADAIKERQPRAIPATDVEVLPRDEGTDF